jgi:tetratricopeptide (TPR) repeat protein
MFIAIGELDYATNSLLSAIDIDDKNSQAYYYLGVVSFLNQRKDDALNFFDQAIRLCPDHLDSMRDSALVFLSNFEPELAQERIKTALKKYPADKQLKTVEKQVSRMLIKEKITQTFRTANNPAAN